MSPGRAPFAALDDILKQARHLLIDFDGPICSLFAGTPTAPIADRLREAISRQGICLPQTIEDTGNWFEIFSFAASVSTDLAARIESELTELECAAVATAAPTPHVNDVISACRGSERSVTVISNNSEKAVRAYLAAHDLDSQIDLIAARTSCDPAILKPSPVLIDQAASKLGTSTSACVVVGDSPADIQFAQRAGALSIGYARTSTGREQLTAAGAGALILSMADLALRLRARVTKPAEPRRLQSAIARLLDCSIRCRVVPYWIKAAPAAPLARRQRRALPWKARPPHAGPQHADRADKGSSHGVQTSAGRCYRPRLPIVQLAEIGACKGDGRHQVLLRLRHRYDTLAGLIPWHRSSNVAPGWRGRR